MNLFEVAILWLPKDDKGKVKAKECEVLLFEKFLAGSEQNAVMQAARQLDDGVDWSEVEVKVRPF